MSTGLPRHAGSVPYRLNLYTCTNGTLKCYLFAIAIAVTDDGLWSLCTRIGHSGASTIIDDCINVHGGDHYQQSRFYIPGPDLCRLCGCDSQKPRTCKAVLCSPPIDCRSNPMGNGQECCDFICLDHVVLSKGGHNVLGGGGGNSVGNNNVLQTNDKSQHAIIHGGGGGSGSVGGSNHSASASGNEHNL